MMTKLFQTVATIMALWAASAPWAAAENQPPAEGSALPAFTLAAPKEAAHQSYLGLAGKKQFTAADIPAEVVIVHIFNMY